MKVHALLLSASVLALGWGGAASAQSAATAKSEPQTTLTEVVVTAERRSVNLQRTAIAASVVSGDDLEQKGVAYVDSLQFIVPSVTINNFGQGIDFNVRGIGKAEHNTQTTTGVITYRDAVPTFPGYFTEEPYYDIKRLEVLRGPQGTLVGQNATGGAVFVTSNDPVIDGGHHGYAEAHIGNYTDFGFDGAVNIPISSTFAARIALFGNMRDSFYDIKAPGGGDYPGNPGNQRWAATRISFLWKPSDKLTILSKTDLDYLDNGAYPADPILAANDPFELTLNGPQHGMDRFVRQSFKIDYILPHGITFRSVSAYQSGNSNYAADLDGGPTLGNTFYDSVDERIWSEEINLISPDKGLVTWVVGAFAQSDLHDFLKPYRFVVGTPPGVVAGEYKLQGTNPKTALAAFGQANLNLPNGVQLTAGVRYSYDKTTNHVDIIQYGLPILAEQSETFNDWSYKLAANWTINPDNFVYAFIATGYRPGGLNVPVGLGNPAPFDKEKVREYEVGWKANFFGGHVRTTLDAFYNNYDNFQVIVGYPTIPVFGIELNVPETTKIYGAEFEMEARFGGLAFDGGVGWMNSQLGQFYATDPRAASFLPCNPATGPASISCINLKNRRQTYAPNISVNFGASYDFDLKNGDVITPRVNFGHVGPQWATLFENVARGDRLSERNLLGAQLAWKHADWTATLYGTNLTDQHYVGALNTGLRFMGPPRQYGFKLMKIF